MNPTSCIPCAGTGYRYRWSVRVFGEENICNGCEREVTELAEKLKEWDASLGTDRSSVRCPSHPAHGEDHDEEKKDSGASTDIERGSPGESLDRLPVGGTVI